MVVLRSVSTEHGELCVVMMSGMIMMPELCVDNLNTILQVILYNGHI